MRPKDKIYIYDFLEGIRRPVQIEDEKEYQLVTIRLLEALYSIMNLSLSIHLLTETTAWKGLSRP